MKHTTTIRAATGEDAEMLVGLATRTFCDAFAEANSPENLEAYLAANFSPAAIAAELADPRANFLIAEVEGTPAGYAKLLRTEPPECVRARPAIEIVRLYVEQRYHGAGIAHALMQACFDKAKAGAARGLFLGVWEHNPRAIAFYRKWGFEVVGSHLFQLGDEAQTDHWMERHL